MTVCFIVYVPASCKTTEIGMKMAAIVAVSRAVFGMPSGWLEWVETGTVSVVVLPALVRS